MKTLKQYELPNNCTVILPSGKIATFLKMDGIYAKWLVGNKVEIVNFDKFKLVNGIYEVVIDNCYLTRG